MMHGDVDALSGFEVLGGTLASDGRTIAAIATPTGRGALAIVRLSGPQVRTIARSLLQPEPQIVRRATRCRVRDAEGATIDDAIATLYAAPHSFTGEDLLEISTHGGSIVPSMVLAAAISAGAREADPGEFTRRAVLNGKLDILQAEAVGDLIDAHSSAAHRMALRQLDGGLSRRVSALRERVLTLEALLAYDIDFPEEDDGPIPRERIALAATELLSATRELLATGEAGTLVHDGALVVLAGAPNVGKSSLFNALLGEARAIVTDVPGTTRDAIEAVLDLPGWPLRLVDTAGLRETSDQVEQLGIDVSTRYLSRAAVVLSCWDSGDTRWAVDEALRDRTTARVISVRTKADLPADELVAQGHETDDHTAVSARTGAGLRKLLLTIEETLTDEHGVVELDAPVLTRARHRAAVATAGEELAAFCAAWAEDALPASVAAIHVRAAAEALGELIGTVQVNDVLDAVFQRFCVGK